MLRTEPHSDPKPEIADPGETFTKENEVVYNKR